MVWSMVLQTQGEIIYYLVKILFKAHIELYSVCFIKNKPSVKCLIHFHLNLVYGGTIWCCILWHYAFIPNTCLSTHMFPDSHFLNWSFQGSSWSLPSSLTGHFKGPLGPFTPSLTGHFKGPLGPFPPYPNWSFQGPPTSLGLFYLT